MPPSSEVTESDRDPPRRPSSVHHRPMIVVLDAERVEVLGAKLRRICQGVELDVVSAADLPPGPPWEMQQRIRFVLVEGRTGTPPWRSSFEVGAVRGVPLAVLASSSVDEAQRGRARRAGASVLVQGGPEDARTFLELLQSPQWLTSRLERVPIADTLQLLSASNHSGMLVLLCPHATPLAREEWSEMASACGGDSSCTGAMARIYIRDGRPIHAETSTSHGLAAFATCLEFNAGIARFHEVHLPPTEETIAGTMSEAMLQAAFHTDESVRLTTELDMPTKTPPSASPPPVPSVAESLRVGHPRAWVVVHADRHGTIRDSVGGDDGEGVAAVAAMMNQSFDTATHALGLGTIEGWTVVAGESSCVVASKETEIAAATSPPPKDAFRQLDTFLSRALETIGDRK